MNRLGEASSSSRHARLQRGALALLILLLVIGGVLYVKAEKIFIGSEAYIYGYPLVIMDAWTNVFAAPGARTLGTAGSRFLLAGPTWQGQTPAGLTLLRSSTQMVWLIGRTQTHGVADYPLVQRLQDGIKLRSLIDWQAALGALKERRQPGSRLWLDPYRRLSRCRRPCSAITARATTFARWSP